MWINSQVSSSPSAPWPISSSLSSSFPPSTPSLRRNSASALQSQTSPSHEEASFSTSSVPSPSQFLLSQGFLLSVCPLPPYLPFHNPTSPPIPFFPPNHSYILHSSIRTNPPCKQSSYTPSAPASPPPPAPSSPLSYAPTRSPPSTPSSPSSTPSVLSSLGPCSARHIAGVYIWEDCGAGWGSCLLRGCM
jgi:hypothetical protein